MYRMKFYKIEPYEMTYFTKGPRGAGGASLDPLKPVRRFSPRVVPGQCELPRHLAEGREEGEGAAAAGLVRCLIGVL